MSKILDYVYWRIVDVIGFFTRRMGAFRSKLVDMNDINDIPSSKFSEVKDLISSDKVVIFSKTYCPYCKLAKEVSFLVIIAKYFKQIWMLMKLSYCIFYCLIICFSIVSVKPGHWKNGFDFILFHIVYNLLTKKIRH